MAVAAFSGLTGDLQTALGLQNSSLGEGSIKAKCGWSLFETLPTLPLAFGSIGGVLHKVGMALNPNACFRVGGRTNGQVGTGGSG